MLLPLGSLLALSLALLAALPLDRELSYGFTRNTTATAAAAPITPADGLPYTRRNIRFDSQGTSCDAWLYTPLTSPPPPPPSAATAAAAAAAAAGSAAAAASTARFPVVIMAHGLGAQKELGLHRFADAFGRAGLAVLVFDYRTFGGSDGEPRHWASPRRHLDDWRAALRFVQSGALGPEYDTEKVALWGTSYAGGHVLVVASEQPQGSLAGVVSMIPHLDGVEASKASVRRRGLPGSLRLLAAGLHDRLRAAAADLLARLADAADAPPDAAAAPAATSAAPPPPPGDGLESLLLAAGRRLAALAAPLAARLGGWLGPRLQPAYIKTVGLEDEMALMQLNGEQLKAYYSKHPAVYEGGWRPVVLARFTLETSSYSPIKSVPRVIAPVLFVSALHDKLCPPELVRKAAALLPGASAENDAGGNSSMRAEGGGGGGGSELLELECTHFEAYRGEHLATATEAMVRFLRRNMLPAAAAESPPAAAAPAEAAPAAAAPELAEGAEGAAGAVVLGEAVVEGGAPPPPAAAEAAEAAEERGDGVDVTAGAPAAFEGAEAAEVAAAATEGHAVEDHRLGLRQSGGQGDGKRRPAAHAGNRR